MPAPRAIRYKAVVVDETVTTYYRRWNIVEAATGAVVATGYTTLRAARLAAVWFEANPAPVGGRPVVEARP